MLLTDFCNRHTTRAPVNRSISGHEAFAVTNRYRASLRPDREVGPQRLSRYRRRAALRQRGPSSMCA
jgi:hypothetical protein